MFFQLLVCIFIMYLLNVSGFVHGTRNVATTDPPPSPSLRIGVMRAVVAGRARGATGHG